MAGLQVKQTMAIGTNRLSSFAVVGLSLLTLVPGIVGGSETYVRELTRQLAARAEVECHVYLPTIAPDAHGGLPHSTISSYPAGRTMPARLLAMGLAALAGGRIRSEMKLDRVDALHFPLSTMLPPVSGVPSAITVLDIQHEFFPRFFNPAELAYRKVVYRAGVRRCQIVITISEHARRTIVERMNAPPENVRSIHLGLDHARFTPAPAGAEAPVRQGFLIYPANRWPHKNHGRLFDAFQILRERGRDLRLVLTGSFHEGKQVPPGVVVKGRVSDEELVHLYRTASAIVFPSLYEGFGQPPLEAMACGCPAAVSNAGPLPEIFGDAPAYFDPLSVEDMAVAVERVLDDPEPFRRRGLEVAARYSWARCAAEHEAVYRELLSY
jgi:glycosyltransferase involved in cell wall biosynthesis